MTALDNPNSLAAFEWTPQPKAEALVERLASEFLARSPVGRKVACRLMDRAAVRFNDLIDSIHATASLVSPADLSTAGYQRRPVSGADEHFVQEQGIFPSIVVTQGGPLTVYLKAESVPDFLSTWQNYAPIEGEPLAAIRRACVAHGHDAELWIIERHVMRGFEIPSIRPDDAMAVIQHQEAFRRRRRHFHSEEQGFATTNALIDVAIADLGVDRACDLFFAAEREYWQRRNRAARAQRTRQDAVGIGWANHDHHTYRSSREHFAPLMAIFEKLGFHCRERFYAGSQAGWGAQVLEQPNTGIVIFADVDLSPDELLGDFAHNGLAPRDQLGTVGLWCKLHGEAFLEAGMHHLECQFAFDPLKQQLEAEEGVKTMKPFTNFPYLRQAFTEGEIWPVKPERIEKLLQSGRITPEQADKFREHGAIGSHLENLERNQGFKGFNQTGVSEIIARTDPRRQAAAQH